MKAVLLDDFGGADVLYLGEADRPVPKDDQLLIKVAASSVNRPDLVQRQGLYPAPPGESEILGLEVAGWVESAPEGSAFSEGDRVMALVAGGGYAEYALAYDGHVMPVPENMSFEQAACVCETYITAYLNLFMIGGLQPGGSALIHGGGGGVNTAALHICRALVPDVTTVVTASEKKIAGVKELGASLVVNYKEQDFAAEIKEFTGKKGVDVILDHIGGAYLEKNLKSLAVGGRLVVIGVTGGIKGEVNLALMMVKRQQLIGSVLRSRSVAEKTQIIEAFSKEVLPHFANGSIEPIVYQVFPLAEAKAAHLAMESSQHFGKIVLKVAG